MGTIVYLIRHVSQIGALTAHDRFRDKRSFRFKGLRYAQQPQRFSYSSLFTDAKDHDAYEFGLPCVQPGNVGVEDCLFLNIWTPFLPLTGQLASMSKPVLFYIHGGAYEGGSGADPLFDGGNLASRGDVAVVTMNYRLGTLGFLALNDSVTNGNFGFADQNIALDWVREHIRDFGGDPNRITIAGQSAGASSVRAMLASPRTSGKFAAAIMQSNLGGYDFGKTYSEYFNISTEMTQIVEPILEYTGCNTAASSLDCLKTHDAHDLANAPIEASFLVQDGQYLTEPFLNLNPSGPAANIPVLMGTMLDDSLIFLPNLNTTNTNLTLQLAEASWNNTVLNNANVFPVVDKGNPSMDVYDTAVRAGMDGMFRCTDQATAAAAAMNSAFKNTWYFEFNRSYTIDYAHTQCMAPITQQYPDGDPSLHYYKCHSGDLTYTFGNLGYSESADRDGYDHGFAQLVLDTWAAFMWNHDPNPKREFLDARGFYNTTDAINEAGGFGSWKPVGKTNNTRTLRSLQRGMTDVPFEDVSQCQTIGLPLDYWTDTSSQAGVFSSQYDTQAQLAPAT